MNFTAEELADKLSAHLTQPTAKALAKDLLREFSYSTLEILEEAEGLSISLEDIKDFDDLNKIFRDAYENLLKRQGKKPETAKATHTQSLISPIDKLSQVLFDKRKNPVFYEDPLDPEVAIRVGKKRGKPVSILVAVNIDKLKPFIAFDTEAMLDPFNRAVHDAAISLFNAGNTHISPDMIYHVMNGYRRNDKAPAEARKAINQAMSKLMYTGIKIDATEEAKAFGIENFKFEGYLMPVTYALAKINGQEVECWKILDEPPLLTLAGRKGQINKSPVNLLDTGLSFTPDNIVITNYLLEQILTMQNPNSNRNNVILYDTVYDYLCVDAPTANALKQRKSKIRDKVKVILDAWVKADFISGYDELLEGRKIRGLYIKYKKQSS